MKQRGIFPLFFCFQKGYISARDRKGEKMEIQRNEILSLLITLDDLCAIEKSTSHLPKLLICYTEEMTFTEQEKLELEKAIVILIEHRLQTIKTEKAINEINRLLFPDRKTK